MKRAGLWTHMVYLKMLRALALMQYENKLYWKSMYELTWHPGMENHADFQSKHHVGTHHAAIRSYYLHQENSPRILHCALRPSTLKGYVGTLDGGYVCNVPLPRVLQL
jgi:hypothetical protein